MLKHTYFKDRIALDKCNRELLAEGMARHERREKLLEMHQRLVRARAEEWDGWEDLVEWVLDRMGT
tara:strand:- start:2719 stop:2916 length:198 start_codon:yes stop_codon:yes gene_type:complete